MDSFALIIFGITSNLAQKYLIPALYDLCEKKELPEKINIIGIARSTMSTPELKKYIHETLHLENVHHNHPIKEEIFEELVGKFHYLNGNLDDPNFYIRLKDFLNKLTKTGKEC